MNPVNFEREAIAKKIYEAVIPSCCNGIQEAEAYLKQLFFIVRQLDDIYDEDNKVEKTYIIKCYFLAMADIATNKFCTEQREMLTAVNIVAFNAWQDNNLWEK